MTDDLITPELLDALKKEIDAAPLYVVVCSAETLLMMASQAQVAITHPQMRGTPSAAYTRKIIAEIRAMLGPVGQKVIDIGVLCRQEGLGPTPGPSGL